MKKHVMFLAAATTLALASCSNDQDVELNKGEAISFRTAFAMPNSRGAETNMENLKKIKVSAKLGDQDYFKDVVFVGTPGVDNGFKAENDKVYYWPGVNSELTFSAVSVHENVDFSFNSLFTVNGEINKQVDVVYCPDKKVKKADSANGVDLQFKHALSQVEILARNSANDRYEIDVKGVRIVNVYGEGTFNGTAWDVPTTTTPQTYAINYTDAFTLTNTAQSLMGTAGNAMLIPQQVSAWNPAATTVSGAYIAVEVAIKTKAGAWVYPKKTTDNSSLEKQPTAWVAVPVNIDWVAGKKYVYTLAFCPGAGYEEPTPGNPTQNPVLDGNIELKVTVSDWDTPANESDPLNPTVPAAIRRK